MARFERYIDRYGKTRWRRFTKINDWLTGNVVPIRKVPVRYRVRYRRLLLQTARAARDLREVWQVNSSYRTTAEQQKLYDVYLLGGTLAARPGTSNHERGGAVDVSAPDGSAVGSSARRRHALTRRGLRLAVMGEPWHVELKR